MKHKKSNIQNIAYMMIYLFVAAILFTTVKYSYSQFVDKATNITSFNSSQAAVDALDKTKELTNRFDYIVFMLMIGFTLAIIITAIIGFIGMVVMFAKPTFTK